MSLTRLLVSWPMALAGLCPARRSCSGRKVLEAKEKRPNWVQMRECLMRNTSRMSPAVLASSGSWGGGG